jgi:tetratricopeptide (TPR) repeat protein
MAASIKAVRGFASKQLPEIYVRARDLSTELHRTTELADVLWGLWGSQVIRLDLLGALESVRQMQQLCAHASGSVICVQAAVGESLVAYYRGDFVHAKATWERALAIYDADRHGPLPVAAGWDPLVSVHGHAGLATLALGEEDRAVSALETSIARARDVGHVPTLIYAVFFATLVHEWRCDDERVGALLAEMTGLANEYQLVHFLTISQFLEGRVLARQGNHAAGIARMQSGLAAYEALGAHTCRSRFVAMLSAELGRAGQPAAGIQNVERELNTLGSARYYEAELLRVYGELVRARNQPGDQQEAARIFRRALSVARSQHAAAFERRILANFDPAQELDEVPSRLTPRLETPLSVAGASISCASSTPSAARIRGKVTEP